MPSCFGGLFISWPTLRKKSFMLAFFNRAENEPMNCTLDCIIFSGSQYKQRLQCTIIYDRALSFILKVDKHLQKIINHPTTFSTPCVLYQAAIFNVKF